MSTAQDEYERLVERAFFQGLKLDDLAEFGLGLRAGKTMLDVKRALDAGRDAGKGKFEREMSEMSARVRKVLTKAGGA